MLGLVYIERTAGEQQLFKKESPGRDWGRPLGWAPLGWALLGWALLGWYH